jgi:hypothetical protein
VTDFNYSAQVARDAAVVGGGEDSQAFVFVSPRKSFHCHLVGSADEFEVVGLAELAGGDRAEQVAAATLVGPEVGDGVSWVRPQQTVDDGGFFLIQHDLVVRAADAADTFDADEGELGAQTAVDAEEATTIRGH